MPRMQFGNYQIIRKIGTGGMAQVFLAERLGLEGFHRRVALKCILPQMTRDERFVQMFINEARLGSQLHHPNIIEIQDFNKVNDVYYIAMEYIEGVDLGDLISYYREQDAFFPVGMAIDIMIQSLEGLGYAHDAHTEDGQSMNIIHRDIKPSNLLLTRRGTVKIADFGIAKAATNAYQTRTAEVTKGSLAYMSPEQITREAEPRPCSDLFALGAVFFEMLSLRPLFEGDTVPSIMFKVAQVEIERDMEEINARYPELEPIFNRALARDQADRYPFAGEMLADLKAIRGRYPETPIIREAVAEYFAAHPPLGDDEDTGLSEAATSLFSDISGGPSAVQLGARSQVGGHGTAGTGLTPMEMAQLSQMRQAEASQLHTMHPPQGTLAHLSMEPPRAKSRTPLVAVIIALLVAAVGGFVYMNAVAPATLSVTSHPSGAQVLLNGQITDSVTPARLQLPEGQMVQVRLELKGYRPYIKELSYSPGDLKSIAPELEPLVAYGGLELVSTPPGAAVLIGGSAVGAVTPFNTNQLEAGKDYEVTLSLEGYEPWTQTVGIKSGQNLYITAPLVERPKKATPAPQPVAAAPRPSRDPAPAAEPKPQEPVGTGRLVINAIPPECDVVVDGRKRGSPPLSLSLSSGTHKVSLVRFDESARKDFTVDIPVGGEVTKVWDFFDQQWIAD